MSGISAWSAACPTEPKRLRLESSTSPGQRLSPTASRPSGVTAFMLQPTMISGFRPMRSESAPPTYPPRAPITAAAVKPAASWKLLAPRRSIAQMPMNTHTIPPVTEPANATLRIGISARSMWPPITRRWIFPTSSSTALRD
jgi:hypothetical protein